MRNIRKFYLFEIGNMSPWIYISSPVVLAVNSGCSYCDKYSRREKRKWQSIN